MSKDKGSTLGSSPGQPGVGFGAILALAGRAAQFEAVRFYGGGIEATGRC